MPKQCSIKHLLNRIAILMLILCTVVCSLGCSADSTEFTLVLVKENPVTNEDVEQLEASLLKRLNSFYISENDVMFSTDEQLNLKVKISSSELSDDLVQILLSDNSISFKDNNGNEFISNDDIDSVSIDFDSENSSGENGCYLKISFNNKGSEKFLNETRLIAALENDSDKFVGIFCGSEQVSSPQITSAVTSDEIMLTGNDYTIESVTLIYQKLFCALNQLSTKVKLLE